MIYSSILDLATWENYAQFYRPRYNLIRGAQSCKICHVVITSSTVCIVCRVLHELDRYFVEKNETLRVTCGKFSVSSSNYWKGDKMLTNQVCLKQKRAKLPKFLFFVMNNSCKERLYWLSKFCKKRCIGI